MLLDDTVNPVCDLTGNVLAVVCHFFSLPKSDQIVCRYSRIVVQKSWGKLRVSISIVHACRSQPFSDPRAVMILSRVWLATHWSYSTLVKVLKKPVEEVSTFWPQNKTRFRLIVSPLSVPGLVVAPHTSLSQFSSRIVFISSFARYLDSSVCFKHLRRPSHPYKACLTPIELCRKATVVLTA